VAWDSPWNETGVWVPKLCLFMAFKRETLGGTRGEKRLLSRVCMVATRPDHSFSEPASEAQLMFLILCHCRAIQRRNVDVRTCQRHKLSFAPSVEWGTLWGSHRLPP